MNKIGLNTARLNTALLNVAYTNGFPVLSKRSGSSADISQAIMDSLVCWYDPGKQQCTNESMAANPVLTDLSGNGHDITCYNFAWSGMSGVGGIIESFVGGKYISLNNMRVSGTVSETKINIFSIKAISNFFETNNIVKNVSEYKIKVTGLPDNVKLSYVNQNGSNKTLLRISEDGIYTVPSVEAALYCGYRFDRVIESCNITIEQLPLYPNALVSDGVDDYCYTDGLPILTDYTVIAKRERLSNQKRCTFASKSDTPGKGAFIFEINDPAFETYSYGYGTDVDIVSNIISYQTTNEYNGKKIYRGQGKDSDKLWISKLRNTNDGIGSFALYSFLLFDRTLTTAEIEWVKKNMIESGGVLKTDWSDSSLWAFYNRYNEGRIDGTISSNRMVITSNGIRPGIGATANFMEVIMENSMVPAYKIKVTGLKNGIVLSYIDGTINIRISEDGIYSIPEHNTQDIYFGYRFNKAFENENIVIQQLLS